MSAAGVGDDVFVVICDGRGGPDAAYLWWLLRRAGRARVAILNGGWEAWRAEGPASAAAPDVKRAKFAVKPEPAPAPAAVRVAADRYKWADALTAGRPEFRPAAELARLPAFADAAKADAVEVAAGGELREACHAVFVLSLLGRRAEVADLKRP